MLTARSVILAIVAVALLSVVGALISLMWGDDGRNVIGGNSYGVRANGYRAVYELLDELDYQAERSLVPMLNGDPTSISYVLWNPKARLVQTEPAYFASLAQWVREGGRLVVSPNVTGRLSEQGFCYQCSQRNCDCVPVVLLQALGLEGVTIQEISLAGGSADKSTVGNNAINQNNGSEDFGDAIREVFELKERPTDRYAIEGVGEWDSPDLAANQVQLPSDRFWSVSTDELQPTAQISVTSSAREDPPTLAAEFPLGNGEVVVVSNPYLAANANLGAADNSVLLVHLLSGSRPQVIFDEFYHGLTVRGNALWLLSKPPYAMITVCLLAVVGVWIWRQAIFLGPSRADKPTSRRSIGEYVEAMSRFMLNGKGSAHFMLSQVREGVLWQISKTLGLPPQQQNTEIILGLLARRQPQQASQLDAALKLADSVLNDPRARHEDILQATRKVSDCLST